jgi:hypothetical protein
MHNQGSVAMSVGIWFWVIYVIGIILWGWLFRQPQAPYAPYHPVIWLILIGLLGWGIFGPPIHG